MTTNMGMFNIENSEMALKASSLICGTNFGSGICNEVFFFTCGKSRTGIVTIEAVRFSTKFNYF